MKVPDTVRVNWVLCDGNAACVGEAPEHFDIDDNDDLVVLRENVAPDELEAVRRAVAACPKHALSIEA